VAAGQQHDENQIYGCLLVPLDLEHATGPHQGAPVEMKSWRRVVRWRLVMRPQLTLQHKKSAI
jgi:hypothetical protein